MATRNQVLVSEAVKNNRFSAEFFDSRYVFHPRPGSTWRPIGRLLTKCEYGLSVAMNTSGRGFPIFRMNEIKDCFAQRPVKHASIPKSLFEAYRLKENDVLFNRTNSFDFVGRTGLVKDQTDCTFASYLIRLVPNTKVLLPEFLAVYLNSPFGVGQVKRRAMRSINQANVSGSEIRKVLIPVFAISVQEEIAALVNSSFQLLVDGRKAYSSAEALLEAQLGLRTLSQERPLGYTALSSQMATYRRSDAEYFAPVAWEVVRRITNLQHSQLRESFHIGNGFPWSSSKFRADNSGEPVVRIRNIKPCHINTADLTSIEPRYANAIGFTKAKRGDIVVGMDGIKYFYASLLEGDCYVNQRVAHLSSKHGAKVSPEFAVLVLNSKVGQAQLLRDMTVATTVGHITNRDIAKLVVPTISPGFHDEITTLVRCSINSVEKSKQMLAAAKSRVESLVTEVVQR